MREPYGEPVDALHILVVAVILVLPTVAIALLLFFVIRWAVLSALHARAAEQAGVPPQGQQPPA